MRASCARLRTLAASSALAERIAERAALNETAFRPIAFLALLVAVGVAGCPDFCPFADFFVPWAFFTALAEAFACGADFFFEDALLAADLTFFDTFRLFAVFVPLEEADLLEDTTFFFLAVTLSLLALLEAFANLGRGIDDC